MKNVFKLSAMSLVLALSVSSYAAEHKHHANVSHEKGAQALSSDLRGLLTQEMISIQKAMMSMIPELAAGNYDKVAKIAKQIKESFILKQKLTKEQKRELHHKLPNRFVEMDGEFHKDAGMLAHVSQKKNAELANFYFSKMNNACVNCHAKFATHKFPAFITKDKKSEHHH